MVRIPSYFEFMEEQTIGRRDRADLRTMEEMAGMSEDTFALKMEMDVHQRGEDDATLRQWAGQAAKYYFDVNQPGTRPTREEFNKIAKTEFNRLSSQFKQRSREFKKRGEKAIKRGGLVDTYDVVMTPEQEENRQIGKAWFRTAEQVQHSYLRNGMVPDEFVTDFMAADPSKISMSVKEKDGGITGLPAELRMLFEEDLEAPQYGAPRMDEARTGPAFGGAVVDAALTTLSTPAEALNAFRVSDLKQIRQAGGLEKLWALPAPSEEELKRVDDPVREYLTKGRHEPKTVLGAPSEEYGVGLGMLGGQHKDVSILEKFVEGAKGLVWADDRATWSKELGYIKNGYAVAASRALEELDPSDPRYRRYFLEDEERWEVARKSAREALVSGMKRKHTDAQEEAWDGLSWAQDAMIGLGVPLGIDDFPEYTAPPKVLSELELDEDQVNALATRLYEEYPTRKMAQDMIALDGASLAVNNPEAWELLNSIIMDPLNVVNPFKPVVGAGKLLAKGASAGVVKVAPKVLGEELAKKAGEHIVTGRSYVEDLFVHYSKREEGFKDFDDQIQAVEKLGRSADKMVDSELARSAARGAESVGEGKGFAMQTHANLMDKALKKAKTPEEKAALFDVMGGNVDLSDVKDPDVRKVLRQRALDNEYRTAKKSWRDKGKKGPKPKEPEPVMSPQEAAETFGRIGAKTGQIPQRLADVPGTFRKHSDGFEKLAREAGQFNRIIGGILEQAKYVVNYIPRYLKYTDQIHDTVVKAGYSDIAHAGAALNPEGLSKAIDDLKDMGFRGSNEDILSVAAMNTHTLPPNIWDVVAEASYARKVINPKHWDDIENIRHAMLDVDIAGSNALHRVSPVTRSAKERTPIGKLYPWLKDPRLQVQAYTKAVIKKTKATEEMKELVNAFGMNGTVGVLGGPSMFHISRKGLGAATRKGNRKVSALERQRDVAKALSDHRGIEMVALDHRLSKRLAQTVLPVGSKIGADAVAFVPKAFSDRLESLMPVIGGTKTAKDKMIDALAWAHSWTTAPLNTIYRMKSTVLRSPAFHSLNYFGAVGLGVLAHGLKALNPKLQKGAHHAAFVAGMGGSDAARATEFTLSSGKKWTIGEAVDFAERYGIIHQGTARHGTDIASGRGALSKVAEWQKEFATSKMSGLGITSAQNVANFADDYQKFVALLGRIKDPTDIRDVYKTLDFVTEYAGNMNQMTSFERQVMRNGFLFYSWNRFILPHLVKQVYKNPARLAAFEKGRSAIELSTRGNAPFTGAGVPAYLWMQRAFIAPEAMQPDDDGALSHEATMAFIETPIAAMSVLAGGFYGESPVHAQLGPLGWAMINMLTGFDNTTGHAWQKDFTMPGPESFESPEALKQWFFSAHDSWIGREVIETVPFGGPIMNIIKLYNHNGMYDEAAELWMRLRAGRDFFGLDNLIAEAAGGKGLSMPGMVSVNVMGTEIKVPAPFIRGYAVRPISEARRQQRRALETFKGL